jgi:hypothetical protein
MESAKPYTSAMEKSFKKAAIAFGVVASVLLVALVVVVVLFVTRKKKHQSTIPCLTPSPVGPLTISPQDTAIPLLGSQVFTSNEAVAWSTDNPAIAVITSGTVGPSVTVKGVATGTATIIATNATTGAVTQSKLRVFGIPATAYFLTPSTVTVQLQTDTTLQSSIPTTRWTVDNPAVASVTSVSSNTASVKGLAVGSTTVTAQNASGGVATATIIVPGVQPPVLTVTPVNPSVTTGSAVTLTSSLPNTVWSVNNSAVAMVSPMQGATTVVTGVSAGTAVVTAASGTAVTRTTISVGTQPPPRKGARTVVYVNGPAWAYSSNDPTKPTPFTTVVVAFAYTNYQCTNNPQSGYKPAENPTSKFDFTLDAFACNGLFQSPASPIADWLTKWRSADATREIFVSVGGAAYQWPKFQVYDAWATNPAAVATGLATFIKGFTAFPIDGIDFDYEDTDSLMVVATCPSNPEPWGATMLIAVCKALKQALPAIKISHAPQGPYLVPNCSSSYINNMGGYEFIIKQLADTVSFYFVQFYNNQGFMACGPSAASGYTINNIITYMLGMGCSASQIVVGKPLTTTDSGGCWTPPDLLQWCISTPAASYGGIGFWALTGTAADQDARWAAVTQYGSPSQNKTAAPGTECPVD